MNPELHRKLKEYDDTITKNKGKPPFWSKVQNWSLGLFFAFVIGIFIYPDIRIISIILSILCLAVNYYSFLKKIDKAKDFFAAEELISLSKDPKNLIFPNFDKEAIKDFHKICQSFNQELRLIRVILCEELVFELKRTVNAELVRFLAAQIVNYLTGEAINDSYQRANESNKLKIDEIRDQILPCAHGKMKRDYKTRELIVYTLRMLSVLDCASKKEAYLDSEAHKSRLSILSDYGPEFPVEANPELYTKIVTNYYKERYKFVEQGK